MWIYKKENGPNLLNLQVIFFSIYSLLHDVGVRTARCGLFIIHLVSPSSSSFLLLLYLKKLAKFE
jgi:hypothetical protein